MNISLWQHQRAMVDYALARPRSVWACGMGTGKTRASIALAVESKCRLVLVATPLAVIDGFRGEVEALWPDAVVVTTKGKGSAKVREQKILTAVKGANCPVVVIGNLESLRLMAGLLGVRWDLFVADECHRLKSWNGKASKWAAKVSAKRTVGMSGTILGQTPLDAFGTWRALGLGGRFPKTLTAFRERYAIMHPTIRGFITGWRNLDEVHRIVARDMIQFRSSDVLDLPPITDTTVNVVLSPQEQRVHQELKDESVYIADNGEVVLPQNPMVAVLRMIQACSGWVQYDGQETAARIQPISSKRKVFADIMQDIDEPVVVWYRFNSELSDILAVCPEALQLNGQIDELSAWQAGKSPVLAAQFQAGGTGTNMTRARLAIYYSQTPSLVDYEQSRCRLHRPGQDHPVRLVHLVAQGKKRTAEQALVAGRGTKGDLLQGILRGI